MTFNNTLPPAVRSSGLASSISLWLMPPTIVRRPATHARAIPPECHVYRLTTSLPYKLNRVGVRLGELFSKELERLG
jgi:hypothetical protein